MSKGIVLWGGADEIICSRGKGHGLKVTAVKAPQAELPFDKTLVVQAGTRVPWDLLPAAWHFLERWDAAIPLWRYGVTAADVGTVGEREETRLIIRDLRVLLHSVELLFVRRNEDGAALMTAWERECSSGGDKRLAFLRALYMVKPRLCVLPTSWLAEVHNAGGGKKLPQAESFPPRPINAGKKLVMVELEPGRMVKVHAGDEERVQEQFRRQQGGGRRGSNR
jgi:hypothetical protein